MKLYEINAEIERLTDSIEFDEDTGEIIGDIEDFTEKMHELNMERQACLEYVAKAYLNTCADVGELADEEARLKARRERLNKKAERLLGVLDRECNGVKTDLGVATVSYRKTRFTNVFDEARAVSWLAENGHDECIKTVAPTVKKAEVKKLILTEGEVPGIELTERTSCSVK